MKAAFSRLASLLTICVWLGSSAAGAAQTDPFHSSHVVLDSSQDIFFDQFNPYSYSLQMLQAKNKFQLRDMVLGGSLELDFQHWQGENLVTTSAQNYQKAMGFYFTQVQFDAMTMLNRWNTLFLSLLNSHVSQQSNQVSAQHLFYLLGDIDQFPLYATVGINNVPFGVFTPTGQWNVPLTSAYFMPLPTRQISLGFYKSKLNLGVTVFKDYENHNTNYAYSLYYNPTLGAFTFNVGAGYITDLKTDSTGSSLTRVVAKKYRTTLNMGGIWDYNASVNYKLLTATGEYIAGNRKVGFNTGMPQAFSFTVSYMPKIWGTDTTFAIGRSATLYLHEIPAPLSGRGGVFSAIAGLRNDWSINVSRSIFMKNFLLTFDMERQVTYNDAWTYVSTLDFTAYL